MGICIFFVVMAVSGLLLPHFFPGGWSGMD